MWLLLRLLLLMLMLLGRLLLMGLLLRRTRWRQSLLEKILRPHHRRGWRHWTNRGRDRSLSRSSDC